jgi:outer membrane protein TolC
MRACQQLAPAQRVQPLAECRSARSRLGQLAIWFLLAGFTLGCSRIDYRQAADRDSYHLLESRELDSRWTIPRRSVEALPRSRFADPTCPDRTLMPVDDPAANVFMRHPDGYHNHAYYDRFGQTPDIEQPEYLASLPRNEQGEVELDPLNSVDLSLVHSRAYQTQFELIYLSALSLSGNRFEFDTQWSDTLAGDYTAAGQAPNDSRFFALTNRLGLSRNLARGGQFATGLANSFSWEFGNGPVSNAGGAIVAALTLPLLRGAGTYVRLESLVQAERDLLFAVRDFARFRRRFYLEIVSSYFSLLGQVQAIRNTELNLKSLELNLLEHQELLARKMVSQIQVDQVFQDYQNGRLSLLSSEQQYADALDEFKLQLGLPTWIRAAIDEELLAPFELNSADLLALQADTQSLYEDLLARLPPEVPTRTEMEAYFERYRELQRRTREHFPKVQAEFAAWTARLDGFSSVDAAPDDRLDWNQQSQIANQLRSRLEDLAGEITADERNQESYRAEVLEGIRPGNAPAPNPELELDPEARKWARMVELVGRRLREQLSELYTAEIQSRVYAIELEPVALQQETAVQFALENRLDLMNRRSQVVDAFRRVEVTANDLRSQLDVNVEATLGTDPDKPNPLSFDEDENVYRAGFQFDGPLNRMAERNAYRASQIAYQRSRRDYMQAEDEIVNAVREDLRRLRIQRLNFQIVRQQLITATRQVDEAQFNLRTAVQSSTNLTRDLLQALQGLLAAKNNLVSSWIGYKVSRINLFVDLELLYLDDSGRWTNEDLPLSSIASLLQGSDVIDERRAPFGIERSPLFQNESQPERAQPLPDATGESLELPPDSADPVERLPQPNPLR